MNIVTTALMVEQVSHVLENLPPKGNLVLHGAGLGAK